MALESVCYDILFNEYVSDASKPGYPIDLKVEVADHLSQCASSDYWPVGLQYDPEGDGSILGSLGVFEHWNNATDRQYSRNLGTGNGIELVYGTSEIIDYCDSANIVITPTTIDVSCAGSCDGNIGIEVSGSYPGFSYGWSNGSTSKDLSNLPAGTYTLTVTDAHDCNAEESMTITDPEIPVIGVISGKKEVEASQTYTYSVTDHASYIYQWSVDGGDLVSGQGTSSIEVQWGSGVSGLISASSESDLGWPSDTSFLDISINTSGSGDLEALGISIYPNPARDFLTIEASGQTHYSISLSSVSGAVIFSASFEGTSRIDLSEYSNGVYLLSIKSGNFTATKRIIKQ